MKIPGFCLSILFLFSTAVPQDGPTIPNWIKPGVTVTYDAVSAFVNNGRFSQGIQMVMTTRVMSVSGNKVFGRTNMQTVGSPIGGTHDWTCTASANCTTDRSGLAGVFWVDPAHPTQSIHGANGEIYSVAGHGPYTYGGHTWDAVMLSYNNPQTGIQLATTFEAKTGLVLAHSEVSPAEQVHVYFRSMRGQ